MDRTRHQVWRVLPPAREDEGSGKCRLSVGTMRAMGLSLAAPLVLRTPNKEVLVRAYPSRQEGESALVEVDQLVCRALASGMKERGGEQQHGKLGGDGEEEASLSACSVVSAQSVSLIPLTPCSATEPELRCHLERLVVKSDFTVGSANGPFHFRVGSTVPEAAFVQIHSSTKMSLVTEHAASPLELGLHTQRALQSKQTQTTTDESEDEAPTGETSREKQDKGKGGAIDSIGGLKGGLASLRELVYFSLVAPEALKRFSIEPPKGLLLKGPSGVGKTLLARTVARHYDIPLVAVNGGELYTAYAGQTESRLRKVFEKAGKLQPSIVFIDEIDALCPKREDAQSTESRVVAQLLTLMDGLRQRTRVLVVAATNRPNSLDPALRRPGRFDREIEVRPPDEDERLDILRVHTRAMPLHREVDLQQVAGLTVGFVGADLAALCREAALLAIKRYLHMARDASGDPTPTAGHVTPEDFEQVLAKMYGSCRRGMIVDVNKTGWDDIGGLGSIKQKLMETVEWPILYKATFQRFGIEPSRGILLVGPPGGGKTTIAKAIASSCNQSFFSLNAASLYSPYLGDSEALIRDTFKKARQNSPAVVFIDEIDCIVAKRATPGEGSADGVQARVLSTLLNELDGVERSAGVLLLAATNRLDMLDSALIRPGRIDQVLQIPLPDQQTRQQILEVHSRQMALEPDVRLATIAEQTESWSGAELQSLCQEAALVSLRRDLLAARVTMADFATAKRAVTRGLSLREWSQERQEKGLSWGV